MSPGRSGTDDSNPVSYTHLDVYKRQVLVRQSDDNQLSYDTYHVYDNYGNLCMVLPPMAADYFFDEGEWLSLIHILGYDPEGGYRSGFGFGRRFGR